MTTEVQTLLMFKGLTASLSEGQLVKYKAAEQKFVTFWQSILKVKEYSPLG